MVGKPPGISNIKEGKSFVSHKITRKAYNIQCLADYFMLGFECFCVLQVIYLSLSSTSVLNSSK